MSINFWNLSDILCHPTLQDILMFEIVPIILCISQLLSESSSLEIYREMFAAEDIRKYFVSQFLFQPDFNFLLKLNIRHQFKLGGC